ncbi:MULTISPECIES: type II toxin-antitoxin system RelB/DinJ family antitoxin [unclassified Pseudomonas]|uniref:type II toxin-antitoxin system RelB/DinJ family antitoxin n=1 Tax=unclassified Pseudomonas TaxID=196821 RepID=UPI0021159007|nr:MULTISPECIES: type II toxin-antitoxin system RelB/DinJ family antitoxin [unclassified Pseudomonas]
MIALDVQLRFADSRSGIDKDLEAEASKVLDAHGLTLADAVRLFLIKVVTTQNLPFETRKPSPKAARAIREAREIGRRFDSMDEGQRKQGRRKRTK